MFSLSSRYVQRGWAFALGAFGVLGFAPFFYVPCLLFSLLGIWFLFTTLLRENKDPTDLRSRLIHAGILGWFFGWGYFVAGLYWLSNALLVDAQAFWWLIPPSFLGLPAILALFIAIPFVITAAFSPKRGSPNIILFASLWVMAEWVRGHVFTGFPWNLMGYTWGGINEMAQLASVGGVYLLSFLTLLLALSWEWVWRPSLKRKLRCALIMFLGILCWGWGRERLAHPDLSAQAPFAIRLIQPNILQTLKWDPERREENFQKLIRLTIQPTTFPLKAVIWPESALSFVLEYAPFHRRLIGEALPSGALLFTGGLRTTPQGVLPFRVWNSLLVLDDRGEVLAYSDKSHLVPFGEYLPWRQILDALFGHNVLKKITAGNLDYTPGEGPRCISLPTDLPSFTGLVCYEVIFPGAILHPTQERPGWIVNVTNDAWYGDSTGPYQHLETAHFRAIEEGIPLVRVANSGVSAVFDAYGRTRGTLPLNTEGFLDLTLPPPLAQVPLYARGGEGIFFAFLLLCVLGGIGDSLRRRKSFP